MGTRATHWAGQVAVVAAFVIGGFIAVPLLSGAPDALDAALAPVADSAAPGRLAEPGVEPEVQASAEAGAIDSASVTPPGRPEAAMPMVVSYVHDGDTLFLLPEASALAGSELGRLKVRLTGLDTPEIGDAAECFGAEATQVLRDMLPEGDRVWATADQRPTDTYGRSLFYLWTEDGRFVNYELVATGAAVVLNIPPNEAYADVFDAAEEAAWADSRGLWGAC